MTKTSGWPGSVQSGSHRDPPGTVGLGARRLGQDARQGRRLHAGRPDDRVRRDALRAAGDSTSRPSPSMLVTRVPVRISTPMRSSALVGLAGTARRRTRGGSAWPASTSSTTALAGVDRAELAARASGARARRSVPRPRTPVGPPPTTANVSHRRRSASDGAVSASSNAAKMRRRRFERVVDRLHRRGSAAASSSRPKYDVVDAGRDDQAVVGQRDRRPQRAGRRGPSAARDRSR